MIEDWLYGQARLDLREKSLLLLLKNLGGDLANDGTPLHSTEQLYAAAHDWVSHGNPTTDGILKFYMEHYNDLR